MEEVTAKFSWTKLGCFIGAGVLVLLGFIALAGGILRLTAGAALPGAALVLAAVVLIGAAVLLYLYYQRYDAARKKDEGRE